jgi:hypothetical protein
MASSNGADFDMTQAVAIINGIRLSKPLIELRWASLSQEKVTALMEPCMMEANVGCLLMLRKVSVMMQKSST